MMEEEHARAAGKHMLLMRLGGRWKWFMLPIAVLMGLGVIAAVLFINLSHESQPTQDTSAWSTKFGSPQALIEKATAGLSGKVYTATKNIGTGGLDASGHVVYTLLPYQVSGKHFRNLPLQGVGIAYTGDSTQAEVNYDKLTKFSKMNGLLTATVPTSGTTFVSETETAPLISWSMFGSETLVCVARWTDISKVSAPGTQLVSLGCAEKTSYKKVADSIDPFYKAYMKSPGKHDSSLVFGAPEVVDGANGYKRATLYQEDGTSIFTGLYYQAPSDDTWIYVAHKHSLMGGLTTCATYNTTALKSAFKGFACYDEAAKKNGVVG